MVSQPSKASLNNLGKPDSSLNNWFIQTAVTPRLSLGVTAARKLESCWGKSNEVLLGSAVPTLNANILAPRCAGAIMRPVFGIPRD
jgi:hypothetical protein